jgi:gamma-glutamyltranspeptidase/glutathione hydrolase
MFHTRHFPASCYPRTRKPGNIAMENAVGTEVMDDLRRRGHRAEEAPDWSVAG